jgi:hypothetical protein
MPSRHIAVARVYAAEVTTEGEKVRVRVAAEFEGISTFTSSSTPTTRTLHLLKLKSA